MARVERKAYKVVTLDPTISFVAFRAARYNAFFWTWKVPDRALDFFNFSPDRDESVKEITYPLNSPRLLRTATMSSSLSQTYSSYV